MRWEKLGQIFCPTGESDWMQTHASNPVAEPIGGGLVRVYFSCRDRENRASIAFVEIDLDDPRRILRLSDTPVLGPGETGAFDDSGTSMGCLVKADGRTFLYYLGWNLGVTVPWRNSIGLATRDAEDDHFARFSRAPIADRSDIDPFSMSYPWVLRDDGVWRMWYGSNLAWGSKQEDMAHVVKYAESPDGIAWERRGIVAIDFAHGGEYAISRPCVLKDAGCYKMWYSYRGDRYRIGYAESNDAVAWIRKDAENEIDVSSSGWDSQMIEYAHVFDLNGRRFMLYNGNGYGKTGFGLARMAHR